MFDMMTPMRQAKAGDLITLKKMTKSQGYIIDAHTVLYFVKLDEEKQNVLASISPSVINPVKLSLRAVKQITHIDGTSVYLADPRDMVYGQ